MSIVSGDEKPAKVFLLDARVPTCYNIALYMVGNKVILYVDLKKIRINEKIDNIRLHSDKLMVIMKSQTWSYNTAHEK